MRVGPPAQGSVQVQGNVSSGGFPSLYIGMNGTGYPYGPANSQNKMVNAVDYAPLTADLRKLGKNECTVSSTAAPLKAPDGTLRLEVACSDGLPGYVINYAPDGGAKEAVACTFAGNCTLPTNKKKG